MRARARAFVWDILWSAGTAGVLSFPGYRMAYDKVSWLTIAFLLAPVLLYSFMFIGPVAITLYGLARGRAGVVIGPIAVIVAVISSLHASASQARSAAEKGQAAAIQAIAALDSRSFAAAASQHDIIAIEGEARGCDTLCVQLIAQSSHGVAIKPRDSGGWTLYRKIDGDQCYDERNGASALAFLRAGYARMCASATEERALPDALVIRPALSQAYGGSLPREFIGFAYELIERRVEREQVLGRWISGRVFAPPSEGFNLGPGLREVEVGAKFTRAEFFSAALGLSLSASDAPGTTEQSALLDALERLMDQSALRKDAVSAYREVARRGGDARIDILRPRLERFLSSDDRESVEFGLTLLDSVNNLDLSFARPYLQRFLDSGDLELTVAALRGLSAFTYADRAFAQQQVTELAFSPMLHEDKRRISDCLISEFNAVSGPFPPDVRMRAKALFAGDEHLSRGQRKALLAIISHGGPAMHQEAVEAVFALTGTAFEDSINAIGSESQAEGWYALDTHGANGWTSQEMERLVERAAAVPNDRLKRYVDNFRFSTSFDRLESRLTALVKARLSAAEDSATPNQQEIDNLKRMIKIIPRNIAG